MGLHHRYNNIKTNSAGGALLFALITAFVLSLVSATFVFLTSNQYRMINSEIERTRAFYLAQAAAELAIYNLYSETDGWIPTTGDSDGDGFNDVTHQLTEVVGGVGKVVDIFIEEMPAGGISDYQIQVTCDY